MAEENINNVILRSLDAPSRFAFWTSDEAAVLFLPTFFGLFIQMGKIGMMISVILYFLLKITKENLGAGSVRHAIYWYFPTYKKSLKVYVPSYIREFIG